MVRKTLDDLRNETKEMLVSEDVCGVLSCDPHWIRQAARERPELLGFPVVVMRSRVKIPRIPFLRFMGVEPAAIAQR